MRVIIPILYFLFHLMINLITMFPYFVFNAFMIMDGVGAFRFLPSILEPMMFVGVAAIFSFVDAGINGIRGLIQSKNKPTILVRIFGWGAFVTTVTINAALWLIRIIITMPMLLYFGATWKTALGDIYSDLMFLIPLTLISSFLTWFYRQVIHPKLKRVA